MHEIVTLQFGAQANFVGTHFWNAQESYFTYGAEEESPVDHDVHFRPGRGSDGSETYSPRTVIYDIKQNFGSLRQISALYEPPAPQLNGHSVWNGNSVVQRQEPIRPSAYQVALDAGNELPSLTTDTVRYWSDYNHVFYHPRSLVQLESPHLNPAVSAHLPATNGSSSQPQTILDWDTGYELYQSLDRDVDLFDRDVRPFVEECDQLQALQIWTSTEGGWGSFAYTYINRLRDEFPRTSLWVWGMEEQQHVSGRRRGQCLENSARFLHHATESASMYIPATYRQVPSYIHIDPRSKWHTSAVTMSMIESLSLPSRLRTNQSARMTMQDIEAVVNASGRRVIARPSIVVEGLNVLNRGRLVNGDAHLYPAEDDETKTIRHAVTFELTTNFFTNPPDQSHLYFGFGQVEVLRGPWRKPQKIVEANATNRNMVVANGRAPHQTTQMTVDFPLTSSFPRIYDFEEQQWPQTCGTDCSLFTDTFVALAIGHLAGDVRRRPLGGEEREVVYNDLMDLREAYLDGYEMEDEYTTDDD